MSPTARHQLALTQSMPVALGTGGARVTAGVAAVLAARSVPFHWLAEDGVRAAHGGRAEDLARRGGDAGDRREAANSCSPSEGWR